MPQYYTLEQGKKYAATLVALSDPNFNFFVSAVLPAGHYF